MGQKPASEAVDQAQIALNRRMAIVGQLTGGVIHDFNNILTVITGTIEILAEAVADRPDLAAVTRLIDEAATRGVHLTSLLLAFARGQASSPREVDVNAVLGEAARLLRPTLAEQIDIGPVPVAGVVLALVDPDRLMAAILNLVILARDAMPLGGSLSFEPGTTLADRASETGATDGVVFAISATPRGHLPARAAPLLTDLGIVDDLIRQCDGHIRVCREAGHKTTVKIHLPPAPGIAASVPQGCRAGGTQVQRLG